MFRALLALTLAVLPLASRAGPPATSSTTSSAENEEVETIRFDVRMPPECPSEQELLAQIKTHTTRFRVGAAGARTFVVEVDTKGDKGATGRLSIVTDAEASGTRTLRGKTCDEVVAALALMTALAIDPAASVEPIAPATSAASSTSASASTTASAPAPPRAPAKAGPVEPRAETVRVWTVGVAGEVVTGLSRGPLYGVNAFVARALGPVTVRLGAHAAFGAEMATTVGDARVARFAATLDVCPFSFSPSPRLALQPCAQLGSGVLEARGSNTANARTARSPLFFGGLLARVGWTPHPAVLLELGLGGLVPFRQYRYRFEPDVEIHRTAPVSLFAELSIAARF